MSTAGEYKCACGRFFENSQLKAAHCKYCAVYLKDKVVSSPSQKKRGSGSHHRAAGGKSPDKSRAGGGGRKSGSALAVASAGSATSSPTKPPRKKRKPVRGARSPLLLDDAADDAGSSDADTVAPPPPTVGLKMPVPHLPTAMAESVLSFAPLPPVPGVPDTAPSSSHPPQPRQEDQAQETEGEADQGDVGRTVSAREFVSAMMGLCGPGASWRQPPSMREELEEGGLLRCRVLERLEQDNYTDPTAVPRHAAVPGPVRADGPGCIGVAVAGAGDSVGARGPSVEEAEEIAQELTELAAADGGAESKKRKRRRMSSATNFGSGIYFVAPIRERTAGSNPLLWRGFVRAAEECPMDPQSTAPNWASAWVGPAKRPPRHFCSVCGNLAPYTCTACAARFCCIKCNETHKETRCSAGVTRSARR